MQFLGKEHVNLNAKQVDELVELLEKEEIIEFEDKAEKAVQKQKESADVKEAADAKEAAECKSEQVKAKGCDQAKPAPVLPKPKADSKCSNGVSPPTPNIDSKVVQKKSQKSKTA